MGFEMQEPLVKERPERIKNPEVLELRAPIEKIIKEINRKNREYSLIIGDDASGRVPTLIIEGVLNGIYKKRNIQQPQTIFFAGSRYIDSDKKKEKELRISTALPKLKDGQRILIVTEAVKTGESLEPLISALQNQGYEFDLATIGVFGEDKEEKDQRLSSLKDKFSCDIFVGMDKMPGIFSQDWLSGVTKDPNELYSIPYTDMVPENKKKEAQQKIDEVKRDIDILVKRILKQ